VLALKTEFALKYFKTGGRPPPRPLASYAYAVTSVAVTLTRPLHVSKVDQGKEKGKIKQATLISDFHAHGSKNTLWRRLARS